MHGHPSACWPTESRHWAEAETSTYIANRRLQTSGSPSLGLIPKLKKEFTPAISSIHGWDLGLARVWFERRRPALPLTRLVKLNLHYICTYIHTYIISSMLIITNIIGQLIMASTSYDLWKGCQQSLWAPTKEFPNHYKQFQIVQRVFERSTTGAQIAKTTLRVLIYPLLHIELLSVSSASVVVGG